MKRLPSRSCAGYRLAVEVSCPAHSDVCQWAVGTEAQALRSSKSIVITHTIYESLYLKHVLSLSSINFEPCC